MVWSLCRHRGGGQAWVPCVGFLHGKTFCYGLEIDTWNRQVDPTKGASICMLEEFPLVNVNTWFGLWYYFIFFPVLGMEFKTHSMWQILHPSPILVLLVHANFSIFLVSIPVHIDRELIAVRWCVQLLGLMRMNVLSDLWEIHEYVSFNKVQHLRLQCSLAPDSVPTKIMNINL